MAQEDYNVANASGAAVRADLNNQLNAIATNNSGGSPPSVTFAHMWWFDTTNGLLKQRDAANTAWVTVAAKDGSGWRPYFNGTVLGSIATLSSIATANVDNNAITYAKMQDVTATARLLGRITAGAGDPEELTGTQATTLLDVFTDALKGIVPASGGGTINFLRADGSWAPASGGFTRETAIATTSGSTASFPGIPSGTDQIVMMLDDVSTGGSNDIFIEIGDSGGYETTGYDMLHAKNFDATPVTANNRFVLAANLPLGELLKGTATLTRLTGNLWTFHAQLHATGGTDDYYMATGTKELTGELDRVQLRTGGTFDNGQVGLMHQ